MVLLASNIVMMCLCSNSRCWKLEGSPVVVTGFLPFQLNMQEGAQLVAAVSIVDVLYTVPRLLQLLDKSQLHLLLASAQHAAVYCDHSSLTYVSKDMPVMQAK